MSKKTNVEALRKAIREAGGQTALGKLIGRNQSSVWTWLNDPGQELPAELAKPIELAVAGKVTRAELRPDVFA